MSFNGRCPNCGRELVWMDNIDRDGEVFINYYCQSCGSDVTVPATCVDAYIDGVHEDD